jgi:hypothetical protein
MAKKKKKKTPKKMKKGNSNKCSREKVCGEPQPVISESQKKAGQALDKIFKQPPSLSYDQNGEVYPKLIFKPDSWWTRLLRFLGFVP